MEEYESCAKCLQYLDNVEAEVRFRDTILPTDAAADGWKSAELLKHYNRAVELLPEDWNDENYIIISVRHALLLLSTDEMNATSCINLIRINCNKAQVSVAMAEYYLKKHDMEGALVCLERAQHRHAQPTALIEAAFAALKGNASSLSHLIDPRFCYEPPDECSVEKNEAAGGEGRSALKLVKKTRKVSGDHSAAAKLLTFPPEALLTCKPLRVPKKLHDIEVVGGSGLGRVREEECVMKVSEASDTRSEQEVELPEPKGHSRTHTRPVPVPKTRPPRLDGAPQLGAVFNFKPLRVPKKLQTEVSASGSLGRVNEERSPGVGHVTEKALEAANVEPEVGEKLNMSHEEMMASGGPCVAAQSQIDVSVGGAMSRAEKDVSCGQSKPTVAPRKDFWEVDSEDRTSHEARSDSAAKEPPIRGDNFLAHRALKPLPSSHTYPSTASACPPQSVPPTSGSTGRHSASPVPSNPFLAPFAPPPPSSAVSDRVSRANLELQTVPDGRASPPADKENRWPSSGSAAKAPVDARGEQHSLTQRSLSPALPDRTAYSFGIVDPSRKDVCVNGDLYDISKVIGRGGSSVVYEARRSPDGEVCAIKLVSFVALEENIIASYTNEVKMLLRLQKTGRIIRLFDHEIQDEGMALVMERAEADFKSVHAHLLGKGSGQGTAGRPKTFLPADQCLRLWREMLECVEALHENGVVHLDLKPGNFVLVKGVPKLIDLGISHSIPEDRTSVTLQHTLGTIDYMSPEQLPGWSDEAEDGETVKKRIGRKSDVWALGCILYLLMFGRAPFRGVHILKRLQTINSDKPVPIPDYPAAPQLVQALRMCLQRDPNARASVSDILAFLQEPA